MKGLKEREREILLYMKEQVRIMGYPPTVREICQALHIKSTSTVHKDIASLERQGFLRKDPAKPRALMLVDPDGSFPSSDGAVGPEAPSGSIIASSDRLSKGSSLTSSLHPATDADAVSEPSQVVSVPIVGRIAAGAPILADQHTEDYFPVPAHFIGQGTYFMLHVRGDSMIEAGIHDGDLILVQQQQVAHNGDIVVAMVGGGMESEATVKTFYRETDHIRLQPENPAMEPIRTRDVTILGRVRGVFRYLS